MITSQTKQEQPRMGSLRLQVVRFLETLVGMDNPAMDQVLIQEVSYRSQPLPFLPARPPARASVGVLSAVHLQTTSVAHPRLALCAAPSSCVRTTCCVTGCCGRC